MSSKKRKLRKIFGSTLQGEALEELIRKIMRNETLFPEATKRAKEDFEKTVFPEGFFDRNK